MYTLYKRSEKENIMRTFEKHLSVKLKNEKFKKLYEEEKKLIELSIMLHKQREKKGLNQKEVARNAHITQQQLSKIENGENCNILTFLKVCSSLDIDIKFEEETQKEKQVQYIKKTGSIRNY